jgi:hypothetical protein
MLDRHRTPRVQLDFIDLRQDTHNLDAHVCADDG